MNLYSLEGNVEARLGVKGVKIEHNGKESWRRKDTQYGLATL